MNFAVLLNRRTSRSDDWAGKFAGFFNIQVWHFMELQWNGGRRLKQQTLLGNTCT